MVLLVPLLGRVASPHGPEASNLARQADSSTNPSRFLGFPRVPPRVVGTTRASRSAPPIRPRWVALGGAGRAHGATRAGDDAASKRAMQRGRVAQPRRRLELVGRELDLDNEGAEDFSRPVRDETGGIGGVLGWPQIREHGTPSRNTSCRACGTPRQRHLACGTPRRTAGPDCQMESPAAASICRS
jgi:hypothetical protein